MKLTSTNGHIGMWGCIIMANMANVYEQGLPSVVLFIVLAAVNFFVYLIGKDTA